MNTPRGVWLDDLTWQEATSRFEGDAVVVLPVAYGADVRDAPHLPLKTASTIARALGQRLVDRLAIVMAPVVDAEAAPQLETLRQILLERVNRFRSLGLRRLAVLDASLSPLSSLDVAADVPVLRACNRSGADEYGTSCMLALDPRSVRMPLLPARSKAQAFDGERMMAADADAVVMTLIAKWPDLAR